MTGLDPTDLARTATAATEAGSTASDSEPLPAGTLLANRYRIVQLLGRGGMGAVYAARDTVEDRDVAVKLVAGRKSAVEHKRLREELRATIDLTHPNIARTYTLEDSDGELFIVMERLDGKTLSECLGHRRYTVDEAVALVGQLLDALAVAHARRIVHRDVKPANIMVCDGDRVVLMDFGLARIDDADTATHTTSIKGTPAYMAPEVVSGRRADARADLYAVGLILYELVTGEPPFKARTATELLHRQLHDEVDTSGIMANLASVIAKLTAKDPAERFGSAEEVRAALAARGRTHRRWILPVAAGLLIAMGGAAYVVATRSPSHETRPVQSADIMRHANEVFDRAQAMFVNGQFAEAAEGFRQAVSILPSPQIVWSAAESYRRAGKLEEARFYFKRYLELVTDEMQRTQAKRKLQELGVN